MNRTEFGAERTYCGCKVCVQNCKVMPGYLIPADLTRMAPAENVMEWAESNLLASPGALVLKAGQPMRIPTLVPATKPDGSCIHLQGKKCDIHAIAPFGCAFFSCQSGADSYQLSALGLVEIERDRESNGLYTRIWQHLHAKGLRQKSAVELRAKMQGA